MESLPKLDTAMPDAQRYSFASSTDSQPSSARDSYSSISEESTASSRTSFSSVTGLLNRISTFSRTSSESLPKLTQNSSTSSRNPSWNSVKRWSRLEPAVKSEDASNEVVQTDQPQSSSSVPKDGHFALGQLQDVKQIMCVAFGAFDRYYILWEDNSGEFHEESQNLPESLSNWLSPTSGQARHIPTLQVSFGSNDEFFASDQFGKISSRDSNSSNEVKETPPRLASIARKGTKKRALTIASSTPLQDIQDKGIEGIPRPRLERRRTAADWQLSPGTEQKLSEPSSDERHSGVISAKPDYMRAEERLLRRYSNPQRWRPEKKKVNEIEPPTVEAPTSDSNSIPMARGGLPVEQTEEVHRMPGRYVDAEAQTQADDAHSGIFTTIHFTQPNSSLPQRHLQSFGFMSDLFHGQCQLGDALRYM